MGAAIAALGFRASPNRLRSVVGVTQIVWTAFLALSMAVGPVSTAVGASHGIAALCFLLAPILRQRRVWWSVGALATLTGLGLMALSQPPEGDEWLIVLAMGSPSVLLAVSAWLEPEPARRRSVS